MTILWQIATHPLLTMVCVGAAGLLMIFAPWREPREEEIDEPRGDAID